MHNFKKKITLLTFLIFGLLISVAFKPALAQTTATVSVSPASNTINAIGGTKTINIQVANAQNIAGYDITLQYNPAVVKVNATSDVTVGPFLSGGGATAYAVPTTIDNTVGTVRFGGFIMATTGVSGGGTLASVTLTAVGSGSSNLTLQNVSLGSADIPPVSQPNTVVNGTIVVGGSQPSPSPSPSTNPSPSINPSPSPTVNPSPSTPPGTATVSVSPSSNSVSVGTTKVINIQISNAQNIAGFNAVLKYDPEVVKLNSTTDVVLGSFLSKNGATPYAVPTTIDNSAGTVKFGGFIISTTGVSAGGTLASITLTALAGGTSNLTLQNVTLGTADVPPAEQQNSLINGSITVTATPPPTPPPDGVLLRMSLEGMLKNVGDKFVDITFFKSPSGPEVAFPNQRITYYGNGKYITLNELVNANLTPGTYNISVNGPVHLTKKFFSKEIVHGTIVDISTPAQLAADIVDDNIINALDFNVMVNNFGCKPGVNPSGKSCSPLPSDMDFDQDVDIFDYSYLVANYSEVGD